MQNIRLLVSALLMGLTSCATFTYEGTPYGDLKGQLMVIWVGADKFVYWPYTQDPLTFTPARSSGLPVDSIRPGLMYTDGGSIPRPLRASESFSPWGYAPAYMVHDWLFAAHHCIVQGRPDAGDLRDRIEYDKVRAFSFDNSISALAGVMRTLMQNGRVSSDPSAFNAISFGVETAIARRLWDDPDPRKCDPVSPKDKALIEDALKSKSLRGLTAFSVGGAGPKPPVVIYQQVYGR